ncbi:MAG: hypothetical protein PHF21_01825 [Bacilli bacterium]|nr:hypothetical protein [Bacilli bacterium]
MKIKIAHLYYDLLNLYGEQGNVLALVNAFKLQDISSAVDLLTVGDKINWNKYDIIYIGSGTENSLLIVIEDFKTHIKDFKKAVKDGKYIIATGNSHEIFGKFIEMNNQKHEALGVFDYYAKQNPKRIVGESFMEFEGLSPIIGFQNRNTVMQRRGNYLFSVLNGYADNYKSSYEGYRENNFFGTYMLGPLLIRNPHFTDYIVKSILKEKKLAYEETLNTFEYKAYNEYLKNFYES